MFTPEVTYYFDGYNVLHAVLLGHERDVAWWHRDFQLRVVSWVEQLLNKPALNIALAIVVFDAGIPPCNEERVQSSLLSIVYAPNADDWIVQECANTSGASAPWVVTADRALTDRVKALGARVIKPWLLSDAQT
jgi:predicted RNA-binding protein with PIN domain